MKQPKTYVGKVHGIRIYFIPWVNQYRFDRSVLGAHTTWFQSGINPNMFAGYVLARYPRTTAIYNLPAKQMDELHQFITAYEALRS